MRFKIMLSYTNFYAVYADMQTLVCRLTELNRLNGVQITNASHYANWSVVQLVSYKQTLESLKLHKEIVHCLRDIRLGLSVPCENHMITKIVLNFSFQNPRQQCSLWLKFYYKWALF